MGWHQVRPIETRMIDNRNFTYRGRINVSTGDLAMAATGKKICTIRRGTAKAEVDLIDLTDGGNRLRVRILSVRTIPYRDLTDEHARWEGLADIEELRKDLAAYYRAIEDQQPMTIIKFERLDR
jgi:hypothetical protein